MTLPLFLLPRIWPEPGGSGEPGGPGAGDELVLDAEQSRHAAGSLRLGPGDHLLVGDGAGRRATAVVVGGSASRLVTRVLAVEHHAPAEPRLVLVQALAKGGRDEAAVETATELGADEILAWQSDRSIVRWREDRAAKSLDKWVKITVAATKQSRRAYLPKVGGPLTTAQLAERISQSSLALVLHEEASARISEAVLPKRGDVLIVVGPEGGIGPDERARLTRAGAAEVRLGPDVLRSSTAGPAALAILSAAGRWR